jgi:phosphotransferase system HPr (HPr) family protein
MRIQLLARGRIRWTNAAVQGRTARSGDAAARLGDCPERPRLSHTRTSQEGLDMGRRHRKAKGVGRLWPGGRAHCDAAAGPQLHQTHCGQVRCGSVGARGHPQARRRYAFQGVTRRRSRHVSRRRSKFHTKVVVRMDLEGCHFRPTMQLVELIQRWTGTDTDVRVTVDDREADGKSPMELLLLVAPYGAEVHIRCTGPHARTVGVGIAQYLSHGVYRRP